MNLEFDIDTIMKYFGVNATFGALTGKLVFDAPSSFDNNFVQDISINKYQATMKASQWPLLKSNDVIVINGKNYKVQSVKYIDDGLLKLVDLK